MKQIFFYFKFKNTDQKRVNWEVLFNPWYCKAYYLMISQAYLTYLYENV